MDFSDHTAHSILIFGALQLFYSDNNFFFYYIFLNYQVFVFSKDNTYWAVLTIVCTLAPAILAMISKGSTIVEKLKASLLHCPGVQLFTHMKLQWKISKEQKEVKKWERKVIIAKSEMRVLQQELSEATDDQDIQEKMENITRKKQDEEDLIFKKEKCEKRLNELQSELQQFKLFEALGESYPQSILQFTILLKNGRAQFVKDADAITILSLITSMSALVITMSGLLISLPLTIFNHKQIQFKTMGFQFLTILPLTIFIIVPRMLTICTFLLLFNTSNAWISIIVLSSTLLMYSVSYIILVNQLAKRQGEGLLTILKEKSKFFLQNFFTTLFIPIDVSNPFDSFYLYQNMLTTMLYAIISFVILILVAFWDEYVTIPEVYSKDDVNQNKIAYQIICGVQIGALIIGVGAAYLINYTIKDKNLPNMLLWAIESGEDTDAANQIGIKGVNLEAFDKEGNTCFMLACKNNLGQSVVKLLPKLSEQNINKSDNHGNNCFLVACTNNSDNVVSVLLEHSVKYNIDIHKSDKYGNNGFILACLYNSDKVIQLMFSNSNKYQFDFNAQSNTGDTGFIKACLRENEKAVDLILANYKELQIDLKIKGEYGKTGMDIWPEKFKGLTIEDL